jgi:hypothetical protein
MMSQPQLLNYKDNNLKKYEYVFSGPSMFDFSPRPTMDSETRHLEIVRTSVTNAINKLKGELVNCDCSVLFNAFTEKDFGKYYNENGKFGMSNVFVDSGGLQMVTKSMKITEEQKLNIYDIQSKHEFAMCFDEIPCRDRDDIPKNANSRTNISAKLYYPDLLAESATKTAENIKKQIEYFQSKNSDSKIFYIVQGNTWQDMVEWYEVGKKVLNRDHFKNIAGIALADTCMGNGKLETVDMIRAYSIIKDDSYLDNSKRLHLLGVGSIGRFYPFMLLEHLIGESVITSFDSSTFSNSIILGCLTNGLTKFKGTDVLRFIDEAVRYYYDANKDYDVLTFSERKYQHIAKHFRKKSEIYKKIPDDFPKDAKAIIRSLLIFMIVYQLKEFDINLTNIARDLKKDNSPVGMLQFIKSEDDFNHWYSEYSRFVKSNRIERYNPNKQSMERFFD